MPTADLDKSPFNPSGLALVPQFAIGAKYKVDGAVVKSMQAKVFPRIPQNCFPAVANGSARAQRKTATVPKPTFEDLPVVLLFCTTESGIAKSQKVVTGNGDEYKRLGDMPQLRQYTMVMDSRYEQLVTTYQMFT